MTEEERFVIDSASKADWAMHKLSEINEEMEDIRTRAAVQEQQIFDWKVTEIQKLSESQEYFKGLLNEYAQNELAENPKFHFTSPWGKISVSHPKQWSYDDDKLIKQYKDTDFVKTEYKLNKKDLKKSVEIVNGKPNSKDTGEIIDGITITEEEKINIKAGE